MKLISEGRCGRGVVRQINQDNLFVNGKYRENLSDREMMACSDVTEAGIYAVCDGMGGEQYGEEASLLAVEALRCLPAKDFFDHGPAYLREMNRSLCALMRQRGARIGTTFVGLSAVGDMGRILNIGDSRAYLLRAGRLTKLSRDHTQAQQMLDLKLITPEQAASHPDRHRLTQHLGIFPEEMIIEPHESDGFPLHRGDLFLLCSDGLTDMLTEAELVQILHGPLRVSEKADCLYKAAVQHGGKDNITVVLVQVV